MNELTRIWLSEMISRELTEVNQDLSNNCTWLHGSKSESEEEMFAANIDSLEEYKGVLLEMKKQIEEEGRLHV